MVDVDDPHRWSGGRGMVPRRTTVIIAKERYVED